MLSRPVFVFVPPAWHTSEIYDDVISRLHSQGYDSVKVELPSLGGKPPAFDFTEDAGIIRDTVKELVGFGKDVVVVAHGFSGQAMGELPMSLSKSDRESRNLAGGVVRLVYVTANLVPEGYELAKRGDLSTIPPYIKTDIKASTFTLTPDDAKHLWYHDLPDEEASKWAEKIQPNSIGVFWSRSTRAAWRYIPTTFVFCQNDRFHHYADLQIAEARSTDDNMLDTVEECDAGHFPMLSHANWLVGALVRAAGGEKIE